MSVRPRTRIAYVITRLNVGGPAVHVLLLAGRLDPERFETLIVTGSPGPREGELTSLPRVTPARIVRVRGLGRQLSPLNDVRALVGLYRVLRRERPDLVHTHMAKGGALGRVAAALLGTRAVVHTFHGNVLSGYFGSRASRLFLLTERALARISDAIVALSPAQAEELAALGIARPPRLVRIPLGIELAPFLDARAGALRRELGVSAERPLVGIVARLVPIKGVDLFLRAAELVAAARPEARFVVVGDGHQRADLERSAAHGALAGRVHFLGWRSDLPAIYADLDVVVLTSRNEGTPTSIIEAMAAARAVVATSVGGVPDLVGPGTGLLVTSGDAAAIAEAVAQLIDAPEERTALGRAARSSVHPAYDADTLVRRTSELYERLIGAPLVASGY